MCIRDSGRAILKDGKVIKIVMDEGGGGYLGGGSEDGDAVIGAVDGADVVNTGSGYVKGDYIETSNGGRLEPEIEDGRITGVSGIVDIGLGDIPELTAITKTCLLYTSPSPRDATLSRMPSSA